MPPREELRLADVREQGDEYRGRAVRWGGIVVGSYHEPEWTRIEVAERPLGRDGEPDPNGPSAGRFFVRSDIPYQPEVYRGRPLTVVGVLAGTAAAAGAALPVVMARDLHIWGHSSAAVAETAVPRHRLPRDPEAELRYPFGFGWYGQPWSGDWFWARPGAGSFAQPGGD